MKTIIFSKDRAAQLDLLLRSIDEFCGWINPVVLYRATTPEHEAGYERVIDKHPGLYVEEEGFKEDLKMVILGLEECRPSEASDSIQFLVDDNVFIRPWKPNTLQQNLFMGRRDISTLSLRLHPGINYSYTQQRTIQPPKMNTSGMFRWKGSDSDWGYPFSVDGNVYRAKDIMWAISEADYFNPNSFEAALDKRKKELFRGYPMAICYNEPVLINVPWNRVQDTYENHHVGHCPERMNKIFIEGMEISLEEVIGVESNACHKECNLVWK